MKKLFVFISTLSGAALLAFGLWFYQLLNEPLAIDEAQILEVSQGRSFISLLNQLEREAMITSALPMRLWLRLPGQQGTIRSGEYAIEPGITLPELYQKLQEGQVVTYRLTILEGWTFQQMRKVMAQSEKLQPTTQDWSEEEIMEALGRPDEPAEGWFFPDTYTYHKGMQDLDLLRLAHRRMRTLLDDVWSERQVGLPYDTPYEALIMASIIERETGAPHERRDIAGVFIRRLHKGMRLQTDPTVIYGMGDRYQGRITRADLRRPTPWNTYTNFGLPPTPIALPGEGALRASVDPAEGDTYYFVARGDGTHQFSRTLEEHNRAVQKYQRNRREDYRSWPAAPLEEPAPAAEEEKP